MSYHNDPYHEVRMESKNFWCAQRGQESPPPPSLRMVNDKQTLGRYMGPFDCMALMQSSKHKWSEFYTWFLISVGATALFGVVDFVFLFLVLPVCAAWYLLVRRHWRKQYDYYYRAMDEIITTQQPQWVPYDKHRLKLIDRNPRAIWP